MLTTYQAGLRGATAWGMFEEAALDLGHPRKQAAATWAAETMAGRSAEWIVDREVWREAAQAGIQALTIGDPVSAVEAMLTFEGIGLGAADNGLAFALASQVFAMQRAFDSAASELQRARWQPGLLAGDVFGSFAMSEPDAGSDTSAVATTADEQPDGSWVLNGVKSWVTLGPICDVAIVFATSDASLGTWGLSAFLVDATTEGFNRGPAREKLGLASCPFGELTLTDCRVPADALLGKAGAGASIFGRAVEAERVFLYAAQLGAMERVLDRTVTQARRREQGGANIGSYQAVSHRIVDMKLRHESARLLAYKAAAVQDRGDSIALAAGLAKLQAAEMAVASAVDSIRVFGASGYLAETGLGIELGDAVGGLAYSGTVDVTRNIVAGLLHLDRPLRRSLSDDEK